MTDQLKTWVLAERANSGVRVKPEDECSFSDETLYYVIEADPILDLLERLPYEFKLPEYRAEVDAILKANGRSDAK